MLNLLNAEFYKWRKNKSFKICLLLIVAIVVFAYWIIWFAARIQDGSIPNGTGGVIVSSSSENMMDVLKEEGILGMMRNITGNGLAAIFVVVFLCIWCIGEYINGAVKNTAGKGYTRATVFLSKYLSTAFCSVLLNLACAVSTVLIGMVVIGTDDMDGQFFKDLFFYTGMQLLLGIALGGIVAAICEFSRNMALGISISILLVVFSSELAGAADLILQSAGINFRPSAYWIFSVIRECPPRSMGMDFAGRGMGVAILWIAVSSVLGIIHFQKTDI